jgi:hypothetical protein
MVLFFYLSTDFVISNSTMAASVLISKHVLRHPGPDTGSIELEFPEFIFRKNTWYINFQMPVNKKNSTTDYPFTFPLSNLFTNPIDL